MANDFAITVTGTIGRFKQGQVLTEAKDHADYYRTVANEGAAKETSLSDDEILKIVYSIEGDGEDEEVQRVDMIERGEVPQDVELSEAEKVSVTNREAEATTLASKADNDAELQSQLARVAESAEYLKFAPREMLFSFLRIYGEELDAFPVPGTMSHIDGKPTGINNPDWIQRPSKRRGGGSSRMSIINVFLENLKVCRDYRDLMEKAKENGGNKPSLEDARKIEGLKSKYQARINAIKNAGRQAIALNHQMLKAESYPAINVDWDYDIEQIPLLGKDGKQIRDKDGVPQWELDSEGNPKIRRVYADTTVPIIIEKAHGPKREQWAISINEFLRFDFDAARKAGGTIDNLWDSAKREPRQSTLFNLKNNDQAFDGLASFANFFNSALVRTEFARAILKDKDRDALLLTVEEHFIHMQQIRTMLLAEIKNLQHAAELAAEKEAERRKAS